MKKSFIILGTIMTQMLIALIAVASAFGFPTVYPTGTTIYEPEKSFNGETLFVPGGYNEAVLVNMDGGVEHRWFKEGLFLYYAELLKNGDILAGSGHNKIVQLDLDSNIAWQYQIESPSWLHHDFQRLDSGNTLLLCSHEVHIPEISPLPIFDDYIIEITPDGEIVWEWHTVDYFEAFGFGSEARAVISRRGGDWAHTNSIQSLPENQWSNSEFRPGNILVSQRTTNIIFIIDKMTKEIVWKIDNLTIGQHDAKMIEPGLPGAGNILVFDNGHFGGYPRPKFRDYSEVTEIE